MSYQKFLPKISTCQSVLAFTLMQCTTQPACTFTVLYSTSCIINTAVLDTNNGLVKTQIFELLSALCVYAEEGYKLAVDSLEDYKVRSG